MVRFSGARALRAGRSPLRATALWVVALTALTAVPAVSLVSLDGPLLSVTLGAPADWCTAEGTLDAAAMPAVVRPAHCDLDGRVIADHGVLIAVPPPGHKVGGEAMLLDGTTQVLELARRADGTVVLSDVGDEHAEGADAGGHGESGVNPCHDAAFQMSDYRESDDRLWHYKASTTPPGLSIGAVAQDLVNGFNAVTGSHNDCGLADEVDARQRYGGNTTHPTGINFEGRCPAEGDGHSVVDFGNLPDTTLARTCWRGVRTAQGWYEITEADVKIRSAAPVFTGAVQPGCTGARYSIEAIVTHEAGHSFGLRHVPEREHPELTMSEQTPACSRAPVTLGLGDIEALRSVY